MAFTVMLMVVIKGMLFVFVTPSGSVSVPFRVKVCASALLGS